MSYNTRYSLRVVHPVTKEPLPNRFGELVIAVLRNRCEEAEYCLDEHGACDERGPWYLHVDDLRRLSKENPHFLFILHGEGEEPDDLWNEYYVNGKCQGEKAKISIADFDPAKLK